MSPATRRRLLLEFARSEAWQTLILPEFQRRLGTLDSAILTDASLSGKALDDQRAQRFHLEDIFATLRAIAYSAFANMTVEDKAATPSSALHDVIIPALTLTPSPPSNREPRTENREPKIEFPPMHRNPFDPLPEAPAEENPPDTQL